MGQGQEIGQSVEIRQNKFKGDGSINDDFVLEKSIFNNVFEKDIRRVFIYKKAERLAKAIHLIGPAFDRSMSLRNRIDAIGIALVDAATLPPSIARSTLSRELLALSSFLSIARTGGYLSAMNAGLISREAHFLLQEIAAYEEPRVFLEDAPTLSTIAKSAVSQAVRQHPSIYKGAPPVEQKGQSKGHLKDTHIKDRGDAILTILKDKKKANIKDISTLIRGVSEKTIQRELASLIDTGLVKKEGQRRWSVYSLAAGGEF